MTSLTKRERDVFPSMVSDMLDTDFFRFPGLWNSNGFSRLSWPEIPSVNIVENSEDFRIELAAPGLEKKDFKIEVDNGILTISAEKEQEEKEEKDNYRRREFSYQNFSRSFDIPENSNADKLEAKYANGILTLTLPKKEITPARPKKEIKVS
jgi:HSP20 family protein